MQVNCFRLKGTPMFINAFKNLFTPNTNKTSLKKGIRRRLELLGLEERVVPANFTVVNNSDSGLGSLRQAILDANATIANDTIDFNFASGTSPFTITLATALPSIATTSNAGTLAITGLGASSLAIDANKGNFSILTIAQGGNLSISGVTFTGAQTSGGGGAFNNRGSLTVSNSSISGNSANGGGAIYNFNGTNSILTVNNSIISGNKASTGGGAIRNNGTITVTNSTLSGNTAGFSGGAIDSSGSGAILTVTNSTISGNFGNLSGGGIYNLNTFTVTNSTISGNATNGTGGGIYNNGTATVTNSTR